MPLFVEKVLLRSLELDSYIRSEIPILHSVRIGMSCMYLQCHSDLSTHEWSALAWLLAGRPPASPTKKQAEMSGPSAVSRSNSFSNSYHICVRGFRDRSRAVAARSVTGNSSWLNIASTFDLKLASRTDSVLTIFWSRLRLRLPWLVITAMT